jgi:RNA polymerase sigma-70 factor (ECF subfamily)
VFQAVSIKETSITGGRDGFPETLWSSILSAAGRDDPQRRERFQRLLILYWKPVYKFVRGYWKTTIEDAKDLTQEFFAHILESDLVGKYRPELGRFRSFLKASLRVFLAEVYRDRKRLKRGGGKTIIPLEVEGLETDTFLKDTEQMTPEELYDREWAEGLMADCIRELKQTLHSEGKEDYFRVYEAYDLCRDDRERPTYSELARTINRDLHDVRNYLSHARAKLKDLLVGRIQEYVTTREDLVDELNDLMGLFRR